MTGGKAGRTIKAGNSKEADVTQELVVGAAAAAADPPAKVRKEGMISKFVTIDPVDLAAAVAKVATKAKQQLSPTAIAAKRKVSAFLTRQW